MATRPQAVAVLIALLGAPWFPLTVHAAGYSSQELRSAQNKTEARVRELRDSQIGQIKKALSLRNPANRRADLYLRLAELELEAYRAEFILEGRVHEKQIEKSGNAQEKLLRDSSRARLRAAISACQQIVDLRLKYEKMDQVLYFLGYAYTELEDANRAENFFNRLVLEHPRSALAHDAWREIGEKAFEDRRWKQAVSAFQHALAVDRKSQGAARVLHRLAWAHYRLKQYGRAVAVMKESVAVSSQQGEALLSIRDEALRDMALFMTESGQVDEAITYFQSVSGDRSFYPTTLEKLGRQYERGLEMAKAVQVYESLLRTNPEDETTLRVRAKLVELDLRSGKPSSAVARVKSAKIDAAFLKGGRGQETQTALQNLRAQIRRTATEAHDRFRKKNDRQDLLTAELFYETYLDPLLAAWDPRKEVPEIRMYLADIKRELGKSREASEIYQQVVNSGDPRYAKEAGALWTASLADAIRRDSKNAPGASGEKSTREAPSKNELEFVAAADAMQESLGDTQEGREAALKAAQVLGGYASTRKDSKRRAERIVDKNPASPQGMIAARLWVQLVSDELPSDLAAIEDSKAAGELKSVISDLRENKILMAEDKAKGAKLAESFATLETRMKAGSIAGRERNKDYDEAARGYEEFAQSAKDPTAAEKAWASSFDNWVRAGEFGDAERVLSEWSRKFPASAKPLEAARFLATRQLIEGDYKKAVVSFERVAGIASATARAEFLHAGARIAEAVGDTPHAVLLWQKVLEGGAAAGGVLPTAALALGELHRREGREAEAVKVYKAGMTAGDSADALQCRLALGDLLAAAKDITRARIEYEALASAKAAGPFKGVALLRLARLQAEQLGAAPALTGAGAVTEESVKKSVQARLAYLENIAKAHAAVISAGGASGIAALHRLSLEAWNAAVELDQIALPKDWVEGRRKALEAGIAQVSKPLRLKALEQWKLAWERAQKDQIFAVELPEISDRLAAAGVAGVGRAQGVRDRWRLAGISPDGGDEGVQAALSQVRQKLLGTPQNAALWLDYGNLLWGEGKPGLARIAYERALSLNGNSASALSNRGVLEVSLTPEGAENPIAALRAAEYFRKSVSAEDLHLPSRMNLASLLNLYRLFGAARPFWDQVAVKAKSPDAWDGLAIAQAGAGAMQESAVTFQTADAQGGAGERFAKRYHQALRAADCAQKLELLGSLDESKLKGFERDALIRLKQECAK
jgi:tetratricopeptide (TPR) repeat protein